MKMAKIAAQERAGQRFKDLDEEGKDIVRRTVNDFYARISGKSISAFDIGEELARTETGQWGESVTGPLTSTDLRWLLEDGEFLTKECNYTGSSLAYEIQGAYLKFYHLYDDWPDLAREIPPMYRRVRLANKNSQSRLEAIRRGEKGFRLEPDRFLKDVANVAKGELTQAVLEQMLEMGIRFPFSSEHELQAHLEEDWKTTLGGRGLICLEKETGPGLTAALDFLACTSEIFFAIEVKLIADKAEYVGRLLANLTELRWGRSYRQGYRNIQDKIGGREDRVSIQQDRFMGMMIALGFNWQFVMAADKQPVILVRLSTDGDRLECWTDMSKSPSKHDLEKLVGMECPYKDV
jgi:hypothetical protein